VAAAWLGMDAMAMSGVGVVVVENVTVSREGVDDFLSISMSVSTRTVVVPSSSAGRRTIAIAKRRGHGERVVMVGA